MRIIRLNLEREQYRRDFGHGALCAKNVPLENIIIWEATDDLNYEKTRDIYKDALADGFKHFQYYLDDRADTYMPIAYACQNWNWCKMFRYIIETGETFLILQDDWIFTQDYSQYLDLYEVIQSLAKADNVDFRFLALHSSPSTYHPENDELSKIPVEYATDDIIRGITRIGTDVAFLISPSGAQWFIDNWAEKHQHPIIEGVLVMWALEGKDFSGVYTSTKDWVCQMPKTESGIHNTDWSPLRSVEETQGD